MPDFPSPLRRNAPLQIEYVSTTALTPMPGAPRRHPKSQITSLTKSIRAFDFVVPVLIDGAGRIVAGHARVAAAKALGMVELPAIRVEHLSDAQIKAFLVADGRLAEM